MTIQRHSRKRGNPLPEGWFTTNIDEIAEVKGGKRLPKGKALLDTVTEHPYVRVTDFDNGTVDISNLKYLDSDTFVFIKNYIISKDDLYISIAGTIGLVGEVPDSLDGSNLTENAAKICSLSGVQKRYLRYVLNSSSAMEQFEDKTTSSGQPKLALFRIKDCTFPLPPLTEQKVIADKLDTLLAQVETTKSRLDHIPQILKTFRQSVLAAAVSGKLTEEWREGNQQLSALDINSIGDYWDEQFKQTGKKRSNVKFTEAHCIFGLPESWVSTGIGNIFDVYVGSTPKRNIDDYWHGNIPWVSSSEVAFCKITSTKESITPEGLSNTSTNVHPVGTVMLAMIGQGKTRGQVAILAIEACHNQNTSALRVPEKFVLSEFLYFFLTKQYEETRRVGGGNNQKALNKSFVQSLAFPLPPIEEQTEIVRRVEELFAFADSIEQKANAALKRVNNLTQSILAKAFRGELSADWRAANPELVSGDNSAEALLEKIKAEREALLIKNKANKKTPKKTTRKKKV